MFEELLAKLFETRLQVWGDSQEIPIAFEGVAFVAPADAIYARVKHLPATRFGSFLEGGHKALTGIWQVSIFGPKGKGLGAIRRVSTTLDMKFPQNLVLTGSGFRVQVIAPLSIGPSIDDPESAKTARVSLPCSISYRADPVS